MSRLRITIEVERRSDRDTAELLDAALQALSRSGLLVVASSIEKIPEPGDDVWQVTIYPTKDHGLIGKWPRRKWGYRDQFGWWAKKEHDDGKPHAPVSCAGNYCDTALEAQIAASNAIERYEAQEARRVELTKQYTVAGDAPFKILEER